MKKEFEKQQIKVLGKQKPKITSIKPKEPQVCVDGPRRSSEPLSPRKPFVSDSGDAPRRTSEPQGSLSARRPSQSEPHVSDTPSPAKSFNSQVDSPKRQPTVSEHCRLYFGALQKAIDVLITSLLDSQPPEKFISHSKLVIMVGKRLVDTLCREAQRGEPGSVLESGLGPSQSQSQVLLCKSNHLCALLKQLAIATKKAALHYPERHPLQEAQDFAKELAQRAQHFRISLDL
ncbi:hypothetical protein J4Q44_G00077350 [Coregonus suidteri]|uniref:CAS family C-terminal domain-containing protein n=1 Tax=Coregonus suidteri TaxID=861788 RepID=A0AAN8M253_9TELE